MNSISSFYDDLDLKYPEIAICIDRIDRLNPGNPKFIIPVLTPNMSIDTEVSKSIYQNSSNIRNGDILPEIANITISNYIEIPLPKELCGNYDTRLFKSIKYIQSTLNCNGDNVNKEPLWCKSVLNMSFVTLYDVICNKFLNKSRYIEKGSKWIVVFVGGDITKPRIIAPYEHLPEGS